MKKYTPYTRGIGLFLLISCFIAHPIFAANFESTLPILLDAGAIPYNQVPQKGQTILGNGSVSWNQYYLSGSNDNGPDSKRISSVPGVDTDGNTLRSLDTDYICMNPRKDGKTLSRLIYNFSHPESSSLAVRTFLWKGSIGSDSGLVGLFSSNIGKNTQISQFGCHTSREWYNPPFQVQPNDSISYRIQYPVGTRISIRNSGMLPKKDATIVSNYTSSDMNGTGMLQVYRSQIDPCHSSDVCVSDTITVTSLSGSITDLKGVWADVATKRPESGLFPIPSDTAMITFHIAKK